MIFFEEEFELLDAFIGEGQDPVVIIGAVHPDDAVLGLGSEGQFVDERFADAEFPGDTFDGVDVMHLIALHDQAAAGWVAVLRISNSTATNHRSDVPDRRAVGRGRRRARPAGISFILALTIRL